MNRALATIALLILSNTFMTLAWYGHIPLHPQGSDLESLFQAD